MKNVLRAALDDLALDAPAGLDSGRLEAVVVTGGRARRRRRAAQGVGVCAVAAAVSVVGVQFSGHQTTTHRPIAAGCASIPKSAVIGLTANLTVARPVGDKLSATAMFAAPDVFDVSVQEPYSAAYILDSDHRVVAHANMPLILNPMPLYQTFQTQPDQRYLIDTSVTDFVTCGGGKLSSLPAGRYRLVVAYEVTAGIAGASPPHAIRPGLLVSRPGEFTIP